MNGGVQAGPVGAKSMQTRAGWYDAMMAEGATVSRGGLPVVAKFTPLPPARKQRVVSLVGANPEPVHIVAAPPRHGPMAASDLGGPDVPLTGEAERRVERILAKQPELLARERTDLSGQFTIAVPE